MKNFDFKHFSRVVCRIIEELVLFFAATWLVFHFADGSSHLWFWLLGAYIAAGFAEMGLEKLLRLGQTGDKKK